MHRSGSLDARKLVLDAITALPPANVNVLVGKPLTFHVYTC
jgi:hypothetical protein